MTIAHIDSLEIKVKKHKIKDIVGFEVKMIKKALLHPTQSMKNEYLAVMGRPYSRVLRATSVYLIYHSSGQEYSAIEYKNSGFFVIGFHGLQQYEKDGVTINSDALDRKEGCVELLEGFKEFRLHRVDYAFDQHSFSSSIINSLLKKRPIRFIGTTKYFQSNRLQLKRIREDPYLKIPFYDKACKNGYLQAMQRLEFSFKASHWKKSGDVTVGTLDKIIQSKGELFIPK
jgi:hypothetical protein